MVESGALRGAGAATIESFVAALVASGDVFYVYRVAPEPGFELLSESIVGHVGFTADQLLSDPDLLATRIHPEDAGALAELFAVPEGEPVVVHLRWQHRDGHTVWTRHAVRKRVRADGSVVMEGTSQDITALQEAWGDVTEADRFFRLLAENAADVVFASDAEGRLQWVSPSITAMLGWAPDEVVGASFLGLVHPDDLARVRAVSATVAAGDAVAYEARFRQRGGGYRWLMVSGRPILDESDQVVGRVGGARDVDGEVRARQALAASEALFRTAMQAAGIGMAITDLDGGFLLVNQALCGILAREESWFAGRRTLDIVHPEDRPAVGIDRGRLLGGQTDAVHRSLRLVRGDGAIAWVRRTGAIIPTTDGAPGRLLLQFEDVTAEHDAIALLEYQALHDPLTGLRNRTWLVDHLATELAAAQRRAGSLAVLFVGVDHLKRVNDSLGHPGGDRLLAELSRRLRAVVDPVAAIGRYGGDQFVVIASVATGGDAEQIADVVSQALAEEVEIAGHRLHPSATIGICVSTPTASAETMLRDAEAAMYQAKSSSRGGWRYSDEAMHEQAVARLTLEAELRAGLGSGAFGIHYQPIVDLRSGRVAGHEALLRWQHPTRGLLAPGQFLDVAEDTGLVIALDTIALDHACRLVAQRPDLPGTIAVNLSARHLSHPDVRDHVETALLRHRVPASRLVLEVTETAILAAPAQAAESLAALRAQGCGVHLDDFGTGFSSIALLRDLPVSGLKLDASFVRGATDENGHVAALAAGLAALVARLGIGGIAEGVETAAEADAVTAQGWQHAQGYYFARPAPHPTWQLPVDLSAP